MATTKDYSKGTKHHCLHFDLADFECSSLLNWNQTTLVLEPMLIQGNLVVDFGHWNSINLQGLFFHQLLVRFGLLIIGTSSHPKIPQLIVSAIAAFTDSRSSSDTAATFALYMCSLLSSDTWAYFWPEAISWHKTRTPQSNQYCSSYSYFNHPFPMCSSHQFHQ